MRAKTKIMLIVSLSFFLLAMYSTVDVQFPAGTDVCYHDSSFFLAELSKMFRYRSVSCRVRSCFDN